MRKLLISTAAVALMAAAPAFAQLGGLGGGLGGRGAGSAGGALGGGLGGAAGSLGGSAGGAAGGALGGRGGSIGSTGSAAGSVGAQGSVSPNTSGVTGTARDTVQGARGVAQDLRGDAQGLANSAQGAAQGSASADLSAGGSVSGSASNGNASGAASGYAGLSTGMNLVSRTGETYGQIVDIVRNRSGQVTSLIIQTADGLRRSVPPAGVSVQGNAAVTNYSSAQFNRFPRVTGAMANTASAANASANIGASTTMLMGPGDRVMGRVISITRNAQGRVTSAVVETSDGVRRVMPGSQLSFEGNMATTTRSEAQLRGLRRAP